MSSNDEANKIYNDGLNKVRNSPEPIGQKYPIGTRVMIDNEMPDSMFHFPKGKLATVMYTYAHAYSGSNVKNYCLDVDDVGIVSWYNEDQFLAIPPEILTPYIENNCTCNYYYWEEEIDPYNHDINNEDVDMSFCPYCRQQRVWDI